MELIPVSDVFCFSWNFFSPEFSPIPLKFAGSG
jgi:hypothetical protein